MLLAKQADPDGKRTIGERNLLAIYRGKLKTVKGILTKPDTLTPGATTSRQKWKDVLEGHEYPLTHGYYCIRLPDDDERARRTSRSEAEHIAKDYLDTTAPWSEVSDRDRFGIQSLVKNVSKLLIGFIESAYVDI